MQELGLLRASLCKILISSFAHKMDEIIEGLADQLTMKQDLNGGLLIQLSFNEEE